MDIAFLIGRIIVGAYYLYSASHHFLQLNALTSHTQSLGVPAPKLAVLASGVLLLIGGLGVLTGFQPVIGVIALVLFYLPVTFTMHAFWKVKDPMAKMGQTINFGKNVALMGSALTFLAVPQPWPFSIS